MSLFDVSKIIDGKKYSGNAKATIQKNGRLGFSSDAANLLGLTSEKVIILADAEDGNLAGIICNGNNERGFKIQKGGEYFYVRMKNFFDSQEIDYVDKRTIYDISETRENFDGERVYKFTRRIIDKNESNEE